MIIKITDVNRLHVEMRISNKIKIRAGEYSNN